MSRRNFFLKTLVSLFGLSQDSVVCGGTGSYLNLYIADQYVLAFIVKKLANIVSEPFQLLLGPCFSYWPSRKRLSIGGITAFTAITY